jgi:integrase
MPTLGRLALPKLTPQHLSALYGAKLAEGLSPRTVQFLHAVLHAALRQALHRGLIPRNPADAVRAPRPQRHQIHPLDPVQTRALLTAAQADPLQALYVLAVMTGMRQGELLGLQWADIDWTRGRVRIQHTLQWLRGGEWRLDEPKTGHSRRSIRLPATVLQALKAQRARRGRIMAWCSAMAWGARSSPRTCCTDPNRRLLARADLPRVRFHDLRHTYATLALRDGVPVKVVSETLEHASITLTLDTYSHVLPDMQDDAAARMERLLGAAEG